MVRKQDIYLSQKRGAIVSAVKPVWLPLSPLPLALPAYAQATDPTTRLHTKTVDLLIRRWAAAFAVVTICTESVERPKAWMTLQS